MGTLRIHELEERHPEDFAYLRAHRSADYPGPEDIEPETEFTAAGAPDTGGTACIYTSTDGEVTITIPGQDMPRISIR